MKDQVKMRHLCWISCFCGFQVRFMCFWWKHHFLYKKCHFSWKPSKPGQYVCIHALFTHTCTTKLPPKYKIYLVDLPSVLYERSGQNETSVLNQLLLWLSGAFHVLLMKALLFIQEVPVFMKTLKTRSISVYTCTIYTYMHHQIPPKYKIYLVGLPSVLYERPGQNETSVLNQLFLLLFRCFSCAFHEKVPLFMKTNKTRSICAYTCTIYTYMHHMHHKLPPNIRYTWLIFPLYYMKDQVKMRHLCWISCFCGFQACFMCFWRKHHFLYKKCHFSWKLSKPGQYVCIHALFTHACTTKYHQNIKYTLLAFPLYSMKDQVKMRHLCWISCFLLLFRCFSCAFHEKVQLFMKTNKTRSICVYTCTIYTYMHHELPPNIIFTWLTFPLYYMKDQVKMRHLCWISYFCGFQVLFMCFWWKHHLLYKKCHYSWKPRKPGQYVCIHALFTHTCPTKYHQNIRYTLLALPLYSMKDQVKMRYLCWISHFCCFSGGFHVLFMKKCHLSWKPTKPGQYVCLHAPFTHTCTTNYHQI